MKYTGKIILGCNSDVISFIYDVSSDQDTGGLFPWTASYVAACGGIFNFRSL